MGAMGGTVDVTPKSVDQGSELRSLVCGGFDWQCELKCCAWPRARGCPQAATVRFDNRPANGQSHAGALRFGSKECLEDLLRLLWR